MFTLMNDELDSGYSYMNGTTHSLLEGKHTHMRNAKKPMKTKSSKNLGRSHSH